ncbi:hypothetical protein DSUL_120012 [Desulfovibrionales bacterium]
MMRTAVTSIQQTYTIKAAYKKNCFISVSSRCYAYVAYRSIPFTINGKDAVIMFKDLLWKCWPFLWCRN